MAAIDAAAGRRRAGPRGPPGVPPRPLGPGLPARRRGGPSVAGACPTARPATCSPGASRPASATGAGPARRPTTASSGRGRGSVPPDPGSLAARVAAGRRCSPAGSPLDGWGTRGTPRQAGHLAEHPGAERAGRDAPGRAQLPGRCALPQAKVPGGYDWGSVAWPDSLGRGGCRPSPSPAATRTSCPWATSAAAGRTCRGRCARSAAARCARRGSSRRPPWPCGPGGRAAAGRPAASTTGSRGRSCSGSTSSASCRSTRAARGCSPGSSRSPARDSRS